TDADLEVLARSPYLTGLTHLSLGANDSFGKRGLRALAGSPALAGLSYLDLSRVFVDDRDTYALARATFARRLRVLVLTHGKVSDQGLDALARCPDLGNLTTLSLPVRDGVTARAVAALAGSPHLRHLTVLRLIGPQPLSAPCQRALLEARDL